jgi:acyl-CoA synthetase (AMP-forming)/AMP-acid ligase II
MLSEYLKLIERNRPIWQGRNKRIVTVAEIQGYIASNADFINELLGKKVALQIQQSENLASLLVSLDGYSKQLTLLPTGLTSDEQYRFIQQSGSEVLITDNDSVESELPLIKYSSTLFDTTKQRCQNKRLDNNIATKSETLWLIPTSGTTGIPKLVVHTLASLTRSIKTDIRKGVEYKWGLFYEIMRFAGLQVFLQCLVSGSCLIFTDSQNSFSDNVKLLVDSKCNALSATPTLWRKLLMTGLAHLLSLKQITLGGEIADQAILDALQDKFPEARIIHIYASTEAGVGFAVTDLKAGFPAHYLEGLLNGLELRVNDDSTLFVRSPKAAMGYAGMQESISQNSGYVRTGDLVKKVNDRYIFLGRENGVINVGGNKVNPEEVEEIVRRFDGVLSVSVSAKKNPMMGSLVEAKLVLASEISELKLFKKELKDFCKQYLEPYKIPAVVTIVDDFSISSSGKMIRE